MRTYLSIDFDFFAPEDPMDDWAHRESGLFIDSIWGIRAAQEFARGIDPEQRHPLTQDSPTPGEFAKWLKGLGYKIDKRTRIVVDESHLWAFGTFLEDAKRRNEQANIVHFDAHHDFGYRDDSDEIAQAAVKELQTKGTTDKLDCSDWLLGLMYMFPRRFAVTWGYPKWRGLDEWVHGKQRKRWSTRLLREAAAAVVLPGTEDQFREKAGHVDQLFICRSGAWVPPWHDPKFIAFVTSFGQPFFEGPNKCFRLRKWDRAEAQAAGERQRKVMESMREEMKGKGVIL
jgi:hypothetical protein